MAAPPVLETEAEWRKRFRADLKVASWQKLTLESGNYMIKSFFTQNSYEILITDLCSFWYESLTELEIKKRIQFEYHEDKLPELFELNDSIKLMAKVWCKIANLNILALDNLCGLQSQKIIESSIAKLNPSIEAPLMKILDQIRNTVNNPNSISQDSELTISVEHDSNGEQACLFSINSILAGMPFVWNFVCHPADPKMATEHLTVPLMEMVSELLRRQQELFSIIYKKDKELEDYKAQGARPSRRYIQTSPFNAIGFFHNMNVSAGFESEMRKKGMYVFNEPGGKLYEAVMIKNAWINKSPAKRKVEDELEEIDSLTDDIPSKDSTSVSSRSNRLPPSMVKSVSPNSSTHNSPASSPAKEELLRREQLEKNLMEQQMKKQDQQKKKKKIAF